MMKKVETNITTVVKQYPSDEIIALLFQIGQGSKAMPLFQEKYKAELPSVKNFLRARGCEAFNLDDVLQNAWEHFLKQLESGKYKYNGEGSLFRWFYGIVRNTFLKDCHNRSRYTEHYMSFDPVAFHQLADVPDTSPEEEALAETLNETLATSLQKQSERNRRLVIGYYVDEKSYLVLANMLGYASPQTAKQRCYMVRLSIRQDIGRSLSA